MQYPCGRDYTASAQGDVPICRGRGVAHILRTSTSEPWRSRLLRVQSTPDLDVSCGNPSRQGRRDKEWRMKLTEFFLAELDREVERSRRALEQVPEGKYDWKPHDKSMIFGYLADMVAMIPSWITMEITQNELDVAPADGGQIKQTRKETSDALVKALDKAAADARAAFAKTTDEHFDDAVAAAGPRSGGDGVAALRDDPGH